MVDSNKIVRFARSRAVTVGDFARLLELLAARGLDVSPLRKARGWLFGTGGISFGTGDPEHKYKYARFTGNDLPTAFAAGSVEVWGTYAEPPWAKSNQFEVEMCGRGCRFGRDADALCADVKTALGAVEMSDVRAMKRAAAPPRARAVAHRARAGAPAARVFDAAGHDALYEASKRMLEGIEDGTTAAAAAVRKAKNAAVRAARKRKKEAKLAAALAARRAVALRELLAS